MKEVFKVMLIALLTLGFCYAEEQQQLIRQNPCVLKQTCHECIQTPTCAWCAQPVCWAKNTIISHRYFSLLMSRSNRKS